MPVETLETILPLAMRLVLGGVLVLAGLAKLRDLRSFTVGVLDYAILPYRASLVVARLLPILELTVAVALLLGVLVKATAAVALGIFGAFLGAVVVNLLRGRRIDCHCFGPGHKLGLITTVRLTGLLAFSLYLATGSDRELIGPLPSVGMFLASGLLAIGIVQLYLLVEASPYIVAALRVKRPNGLSQGRRIQLRDAPPGFRLRGPVDVHPITMVHGGAAHE